MAFDRRRYPKDWPAIRAAILARAGNRCEGTYQHPACRAENHHPHPVTGSKVVLTVAHYHDPDPLNCDPSNLRLLCNRCHLNLDRSHHLRVQRVNRARRLAAGQRDLFAEER